MRVYLITGDKVTRGVKTEDYTLQGCGVTVKVVGVGEKGRGRKYDFITVAPGCVDTPRIREKVEVEVARGRATSDVYCWPDPPRGWEEDKEERVLGKFLRSNPRYGTNWEIFEGEAVYTRPPCVVAADIGKTRSGAPKLIPDRNGNRDSVIAVLRTHIGFRGHNAHTGDFIGWECMSCESSGKGLKKEPQCPSCGEARPGHYHGNWAKFPGEILAEGIIAQGAAGRAGSGYQYIAVIPNGSVFRTAYTGRLYGNPSSHYFKVVDGKILGGVTPKERALTDIF